MTETLPNIETQDYHINMGPQHPSTHGVLRLRLKLSGETIEEIQPHLGFIHRSIEKMCEKQTYRQFAHLTSRMDYLSAHINNQACALVVEKGLGIEAPPKAQAVRILLAELTRLASHQLWWGVMGMDLGAITTFLWAFRDREMINDIMEESTGARLTMNFIVPGGLMMDVHPNFVHRTKEFVKHFKGKLPEYDQILSNNVIFRERTEGVGFISRENAISYGCTGPVGRGSGFSCDVRKLYPYDGYDKVEFDEIIETGGDNYARYRVRIQEMWQSLRIIEQLVDGIPEGEFQAKTKAVLKLPVGEWYQRVETARGDFGIYLVSKGDKSAYRMKFRSPGFSNLSALNEMSSGSKIGDLVATMSTLDLVIPDIDR